MRSTVRSSRMRIECRNRRRAMVGAVLVAGAVPAQAAPDGGKLSGEVPKRVAPQARGSQRRRQTEGDDPESVLGADLFPRLKRPTRARQNSRLPRHRSTRSYGSDFPTRAAAFAKTVKQEKPDIIGLQEVSEWITNRNVPGPDLESQDFP